MTDEKKPVVAATGCTSQTTQHNDDTTSDFWKLSSKSIDREKRNIKSEAIGRWPFILENLGIPAKCLSNRHGPCPSPACGGHDRFRFDDRDGRGTFICNQMDGISGDGFRLIQHVFNVSFKEAVSMVEYVIGGGSQEPIPEPVIKPKAAAKTELTDGWLDYYNSLPLIKATTASSYLNARMCVTEGVKLRLDDDKGAFVGLIENDQGPMSLQWTYFNEDGTRPRDREFLGGHSSTGHIKLRYSPSKTLVIAEGIETALTLAHGYPDANVWSVLNAGNMASFVLPDWCDELVIAIDNDKAGRRSFANLNQRLMSINRSLILSALVSPIVCQDINDYFVQFGTLDGLKSFDGMEFR